MMEEHMEKMQAQISTMQTGMGKMKSEIEKLKRDQKEVVLKMAVY